MVWIALAISGPVLMDLLVIWCFTNKSLTSYFIWDIIFRSAIIVILIVFNAIPVLAIVDLWIASKKPVVKHFPARTIWALLLIGVIAPISLYSVLESGTAIRTGNKAPELLVTAGSGIYGIPDYAISFWNATSCTNTVRWGTSPISLTNVDSETVASQQHAFLLRNLSPNTTYYFTINNGPLNNFTTPVGTPNTFTFAVGSDAHVGRAVSNTTATLRMLKEIADPAMGNSMFFFLGDMVEYGFEDYMWTEAINMFSTTTSHIPFRPILGNHDTLLGGVSTWPQYFYPTAMVENSSISQSYFQIVVNGIHIFCLDLQWGNGSDSPQQYNWFKNQLAQINATDPGAWIIVMSHCFYYASGVYDDGAWWVNEPQMIQTFAPLFQEYHVQMVFSGHNHDLEALEVNGTHYFVDGGFGGLPDPPRDRNGTGSLWYLSGNFGYIETKIQGNTANVSFISPEGFMYNSFSVNRTW